MRHNKSGRKLGRKTAHRKALMSNLASALITHKKIKTTDAKAKSIVTSSSFAGFFCVIFSSIMILSNDLVFFSTSYNSALFSLHGTLVCIGLILYSIGSKVIPAAELTLLSLTEVIGGIFWVWVPILGINEIPSTNTIIGGFFLFVSIIYYSLTIKTNRRFIALN